MHKHINPKHHRQRPPAAKRVWNPLKALLASTSFLLLLLNYVIVGSFGQQQLQSYLLPGNNMENLRISELTPVGKIVHTLKAVDRTNENRKITYALTGDVFSVDEDTGEVKLMKPLDRERQSQVSTIVNVLGSGSDPLESRRRFIIVEDADDSPPVFSLHKSSVINNVPLAQYIYQANLSEQASINSIVISEILVTDADEGQNAEIVFECRANKSTNSACEIFQIESRRLQAGKYSISIKTKAPLDYEKVQQYKLTLVARGKRPAPSSDYPLEAEAVLNIKLINIQDEPPIFVNAPYSVSVPEGEPFGTRQLTLIVQDGDAAPQRNLSVVIAPGPFSHYFQIEKSLVGKIWYLTTNVTLDREDKLISEQQNNMFSIDLVAVELDSQNEPAALEADLYKALHSPPFSSGTIKTESVTVMVLDMPDSSPIFVRASSNKPIESGSLLQINVSESILSGNSIPNLDLAVYNLDQGVNSRFNLTLVDAETGPPASAAIALRSDVVHGKSEIVLNILNSSLLDYEDPQLRTYRFSLIARKLTNSERSYELQPQVLEIQMNILDANDNWPKFEAEQFIIEVPEGSSPGYHVATIKAKDLDSGSFGIVDYMLRGTGSSKFRLVQNEGKILVSDCGLPQCLDFETQPSFYLNYQARDLGGLESNVSVIINVIDINDHAPKFSESVYKRELISDNLSSKQNYISPQLIVRARDADGPTQGRNNITYKIKSSSLNGLEVEPNSGLVYISQPLDLDDLNGVAQQQQPGSGDRKLTFEAEVVAEDNGTPPLNSTAKILLVVKGNGDGAPQFKQDVYYSYVRENFPIEKAFFQVQAVDPDDKDSQLRYSLGFDLDDLISVNSITGELAFKNQVDYDDYKGVPYNITVYATDNSKPYPLRASTLVSILIQDVNNKSPKFENNYYVATLVQGKTRPGQVVAQVRASDLDKNAQLNYSIMNEVLFVDDRNGQEFSLDAITDSSAGYLAQMNRNERLKLAADLKGLFSINRQSGAIELRAEPDYSFAGSVTILVRVVDLNQEVSPPTGDQNLQEDIAKCVFYLQTHIDKSPIFAPPWSVERQDYNISILEEQSVGTQVFSLLAKDPLTNSRVDTFEKLFESDPRDYFRVERNGIVLINRRIDYEDLPELAASKKQLTVSVKALNGETQFSIANLNFQIVDLNDNVPQFKNSTYFASVSEGISHTHEIITVVAEDRDSNQFGQVFYSISGHSNGNLFTIHPKRGTILLRKGAKLDRDTEPSHQLVVTASDCNETISSLNGQHQHSNSANHHLRQSADSISLNLCKRSSAMVEIRLIDENDNEPQFVGVNQRGEFEATTSETVSVGSVITQVIAHDSDEAANGQVGYEIVKTDDQISRMFKVDSDGFISAAASLSGLGRQSPYKITIRAYDHGKISRQSYATLLLTIGDVVSNDGVPKFVRPKADEVIALSENAGPNAFVYQVEAIDPDEEANGKLMYKFVQQSDTFEIDPFEGVIKTQHRQNFLLDREQVPNYTLIVVAQDLGSPSKQAHQVVRIEITDVNDNEPYFERDFDDPPLILQVEEELPEGSFVGTLQAIDKDVGQNAQIGYEIIEGNQQNLFRLSWSAQDDKQTEGSDPLVAGNNPCRIYSNARLDREMRESYTLTIKASSMSKLRNQFIPLRDPLGSRNPFNQYNASDLTKIRVTIKLLDINDNRPVFLQPHPKSVVDSSAEAYSQLMVLRAVDADSSDSEIQYSILDAIYHTDSKLKPSEDLLLGDKGAKYGGNAISMRHVFDVDSRTGILRNTVSLRPYTDGYFEVYVKADSGGLYNQMFGGSVDLLSPQAERRSNQDNKCPVELSGNTSTNSTSNLPPGSDVVESCTVAVTKAVVFVTHQRETFRFVFNMTKLNDRIDEFKEKIQSALEGIMFDPVQVQASIADPKLAAGHSARQSKAEKVYLNMFNTDFYEREDGSLDFSTITSCSQLVKFDDRFGGGSSSSWLSPTGQAVQAAEQETTLVPNQVVNYDEVLNLLKTLNATQTRLQKQQSLFSQYGLVKIERCLPDKTLYKMTLPERLALYFAAAIALVGILLAFIVSKMRKSYEKNLKLLQRSKYQYMSPYV